MGGWHVSCSHAWQSDAQLRPINFLVCPPTTHSNTFSPEEDEGKCKDRITEIVLEALMQSEEEVAQLQKGKSNDCTQPPLH